MFQEKPGLFGTATGEYFDAAAEFQVFDDARLHCTFIPQPTISPGDDQMKWMEREAAVMGVIILQYWCQSLPWPGPVPKDFFERHNDQVIANQFAAPWWQL